ncbi:MAG: hypothetical protein CMI05_06995 [Oceanospirillaceae bacterium]|nr:hypothetical protein [Oceanospirillaceae bacterium]
MNTTHPKLIQILVDQTPRAMIAMLLVSLAYFWSFMNYVPLPILSIWLFFQTLLAVYRVQNAKSFKEYLRKNEFKKIKRNEILFMISNVFQAMMWTLSSILAITFAPQPFELVTFVMTIGIITAAALSMSSLYKAYLVFFFCMIVPQIIILSFFGEQQHTALLVFTVIYIPATILLSKTIYNSRLSSIEAHSDLEQSVEKLHKLSMIDNLTNIYNRRYFFEMSKNIISTAQRDKTDVALLMLDVDFFKKINDKYGHQAGDFILVNLAKEIEKTIRLNDIFARVGGEEFTILFNNTSLNGAKVIAEKIRRAIEVKPFTFEGVPIQITISIGLSELGTENNSIEQLYSIADQNLYVAKKTGRNKVAF